MWGQKWKYVKLRGQKRNKAIKKFKFYISLALFLWDYWKRKRNKIQNSKIWRERERWQRHQETSRNSTDRGRRAAFQSPPTPRFPPRNRSKTLPLSAPISPNLRLSFLTAPLISKVSPSHKFIGFCFRFLYIFFR